MKSDYFENFLTVLEFYKLKQIPRNNSNYYHDEKDNIFYKRRETTAEHIFSSLKLVDFFVTTEPEFFHLNKLKIYDMILYHDDIEIVVRDTGIADREERLYKEKAEIESVPILSKRLPLKLDQKLVNYDTEYREKVSEESKFANGIDKIDALVHELQYPLDWGPKGFDEKNVRAWFQPNLEYSPTFLQYFESIIRYLKNQGYFKK